MPSSMISYAKIQYRNDKKINESYILLSPMPFLGFIQAENMLFQISLMENLCVDKKIFV